MKTPDIPQECGLTVSRCGVAYNQGATFDLNTPHGRAALAAYCMAAIDEMIREVDEVYAKCDHGLFDEFLFWFMGFRASLFSWRAEWSRYGGFAR